MPCLYGNTVQVVEQEYDEEVVEITFPANSIFASRQTIVDCLALEIAEVELRQALCALGPTADPQTLVTDLETPIAITLTGTDPLGGTLLFFVDTFPSDGFLDGVPPDLIYTPDIGFSGLDSFTFYVNNGYSDSIPATITIHVGFEGIYQDVETSYETPIVITMEVNPSTVDPGTLTFNIVTPPSNGSLGPIVGNQVTYTPDPGYDGPDSFTWEATRGLYTSDPATVDITVTPQGEFVADFITLEYQFVDGLDLDTRTRLTGPESGEWVGWCQEAISNGSNGPWYEWGGDNTGLGFESVLFYVNTIRAAFPAGTIVGQCYSWWYNLRESGNVTLQLKAYQGGEMQYQDGLYKWENVGGTQVASIILNSNVTRNESNCIDDPECVTGFTYDLATNTFNWTPCI